MIASLALLSVLQGADGPAFRLDVAGSPGRTVAITAAASRGWLAAFCTSEVCGLGRIVVNIPDSGAREIDLRLHPIDGRERHGSVVVRDGGKAMILRF